MTATAHVRPKRRTRARFSKVASARDTIAGFGPDMDVAGLTYGQFSLIDLIDPLGCGVAGQQKLRVPSLQERQA